MNYYFITTYHTAPKNKKAQAVLDYCKKFDCALAKGEIALDALRTELQVFCKMCNEKFANSREIYVHNYEYQQISIRIDGDVDNSVIRLTITKIKSFYEFSENNEIALNEIEGYEKQNVLIF
jgi:site-specific recombinase XerD